MTKRLLVVLLLAVLALAPAAQAQCKFECRTGEPEGGDLYAHCVEYLNGMWDYNTCQETWRCSVFFGGRACWPVCEGERCYLV